jgi:hypothetical protein
MTDQTRTLIHPASDARDQCQVHCKMSHDRSEDRTVTVELTGVDDLAFFADLTRRL